MQTNNSKEKVRQLQNKLYLTAKKCDSRRFHALYDKVYRDDVLFEAWKRVKANKGSSGVDGIRIEDIEEMGIEKYLSEIKSELMDGKYKPSPVKRVMIPKPDGSERPLGIPTVKDRIVQMATKIAIEPVFEADFRDCSSSEIVSTFPYNTPDTNHCLISFNILRSDILCSTSFISLSWFTLSKNFSISASTT